MSLHTQIITMGAMIGGGIYIGIANDTYQRFASWWRRLAILRYSSEILFWLMQTFLLYYVLYQLNSGQIRFYFFIALAFGFVFYITFLQATYKKMLHIFILIVKKILLVIYYLTVVPIIFTYRQALAIVRITDRKST